MFKSSAGVANIPSPLPSTPIQTSIPVALKVAKGLVSVGAVNGPCNAKLKSLGFNIKLY